MDHWPLCPNLAIRFCHVCPILVVVAKAKIRPTLPTVYDYWKARFEHEVTYLSPHCTMIKAFDFLRCSHLWPLALGAQSSEVAVATSLCDVVWWESEGKVSSSHSFHDALGQAQPDLVVVGGGGGG